MNKLYSDIRKTLKRNIFPDDIHEDNVIVTKNGVIRVIDLGNFGYISKQNGIYKNIKNNDIEEEGFLDNNILVDIIDYICDIKNELNNKNEIAI